MTSSSTVVSQFSVAEFSEDTFLMIKVCYCNNSGGFVPETDGVLAICRLGAHIAGWKSKLNSRFGH